MQCRNRQSLGVGTGVGLNLQPVDGYHPDHSQPLASESFAKGRLPGFGPRVPLYRASTAVDFGVMGWVSVSLAVVAKLADAHA